MSNLDDRDVAGIGSLADPVRRDLYRFVCGRDEPGTRDEAAEALGIPRHRVKFHLDRLAADGLLRTEYARTSGRAGPGAGRPAKRYRRADREVVVSLPERDYALAGRLMAAAISSAVDTGRAVTDTLQEVAGRHGASLADEARARNEAATAVDDPVDLALDVLAEQGYEPRVEDGRVVLANCPFHALAQEHTALVCGMNVAMLGSFCSRLADGDLTARLEPSPGRCCVTLSRGPS
jgi:predicted ArsR family transcriptional regulator